VSRYRLHYLLSSGMLHLGTYDPFLQLRVLFLRNATRPGLGPRRREEGSGLESPRKKAHASFGASKGVSTLCRARCVGRRAAAAAASEGVIPSVGNDGDDDLARPVPRTTTTTTEGHLPASNRSVRHCLTLLRMTHPDRRFATAIAAWANDEDVVAAGG
jgi:hypothetical protein